MISSATIGRNETNRPAIPRRINESLGYRADYALDAGAGIVATDYCEINV